MAPRGGGGEPGWVGGDAVCGRGGSGQRWGGLFQGFVLDRHAAADRAQPGDGLWQLRGHARRGAPLERGAHRCADRGREGCGARRHRGRADDVPEGERRQRQRARRCEQTGQQRADSQSLRAGQRDFYSFTLAEAKQLYFDSLTQNTGLTWTLSGPRGAVVNARSFTASDSFEFGAGSPVLDLVAGDYTLMIDAPGDQTAPYAFHLFDLSQATAYTPGTVTDATLSPARETDVYRFEATAGERYYFDAQPFTGGDIFWRLVNPYGKLVFDRTSFANDVGIVTLELTGAYTLLIEGPVGMTGQTSYRFNAQRLADDVKPLVFGQAQGIEGRQWTAGQLGGALYLDGAMYGEVASNPTVDILSTLTLEAWVKVDRFADSGTAQILYKGTGAANARTYALWVNADGSVSFST